MPLARGLGVGAQPPTSTRPARYGHKAHADSQRNETIRFSLVVRSGYLMLINRGIGYTVLSRQNTDGSRSVHEGYSILHDGGVTGGYAMLS